MVHKVSIHKLPPILGKLVALSPDNRTILYPSTPKPGTDEMRLWTIGVDGKHKRMLVDIPREMWVATPVWSPDSKQIAYVRTASPGEEQGLELWVMDADGKHNHKLLDNPAFNADIFYGTDPQPMSWTRYGDIRFKDYARQRIWTVNGETGALSYKQADISPPNVGIPIIQTAHEIPILSQNDPRWRYDEIGACGYSMGNSGCAITATSMAFSSQGYDATPRDLNDRLKEYSCPLYWAYAASQYTGDHLYLWGEWKFDWHMLDLALQHGRPALVWLSSSDSPSLTHWVLVVGGSGQTPAGYRIYDPWDGTTWKTLDYYTSRGYVPMRVYAFGPRS